MSAHNDYRGRCTHHEYIHNRCNSPATQWLCGPDGKPNPDGRLCQHHATVIMEEYLTKLNEEWSAPEMGLNGRRPETRR